MKVPLPLALLTSLAWAALDCERTATRQDTSAVRDSAGVRIVESQRGTWTTPWHVGAEPIFSIGSADGDPDQLLYRVIGAIGLPGGRIVIANEGSLELLFYDEAGNFLHRAGRRGGGPGEFQSLEWLARYGPDSVLAVDVSGQRVSYFDADGNFGRSVRLEPNAQIPFPRPVGVFGDGSLLATQGSFSLGGEPPVRAE
ncbi:MAG: 6-bladed beta-propeller, partial [Gemmatimonadales bacterium]